MPSAKDMVVDQDYCILYKAHPKDKGMKLRAKYQGPAHPPPGKTRSFWHYFDLPRKTGPLRVEQTLHSVVSTWAEYEQTPQYANIKQAQIKRAHLEASRNRGKQIVSYILSSCGVDASMVQTEARTMDYWNPFENHLSNRQVRVKLSVLMEFMRTMDIPIPDMTFDPNPEAWVKDLTDG